MSNTKKFPTKLVLGGLLILAILGAAYYFLFSGNTVDTSTSIQVSTSSANGFENDSRSSVPDTEEILRQLNALREITINTDLFNSQSFLNLVDFSVNLNPQSVGRDNPFTPSTFTPSGPTITPRENPAIPEQVGGGSVGNTESTATETDSVATSSTESDSSTTSPNEELSEE